MNSLNKSYKTPVATPEEIARSLSELGEDATADRIEQIEQALADLDSPSALGSSERAHAVRGAVAAVRLALDAPEPVTHNVDSKDGSSAVQARAVLATERRLAGVVPSAGLKAHVLTHGYRDKGITPLAEYTFLAAVQRRTERGIYVVDGNLNRDVFKQLVKEAQAASLQTDKFYIFAKMATYTGHGIEIMRLDTLPPFERVPEQGDIGFYRPDPSGKLSPHVVLAATATVVRMYVAHSDMEFEIPREEWMSTEEMEESTVDLLSDPRYAAGGEMSDMRDRILGERVAAMARAISVAQAVPRILREYQDASTEAQPPIPDEKTQSVDGSSIKANVHELERDVSLALRGKGWNDTRMGQAATGNVYVAKSGGLSGDAICLFDRTVHHGALLSAPVTAAPDAIAAQFAAFARLQSEPLPDFAADLGDDSQYLVPVQSRVIVFLPQASFRPEPMRVTERAADNGTWFGVETYNPRMEQWIEQKMHAMAPDAVRDALGWYPDPAFPGFTTPAQITPHPVTQAQTREPDSAASLDV